MRCHILVAGLAWKGIGILSHPPHQSNQVFAMTLTLCKHCSTRVWPSPTGQCPSCRRAIDGTLPAAEFRPFEPDQRPRQPSVPRTQPIKHMGGWIARQYGTAFVALGLVLMAIGLLRCSAWLLESRGSFAAPLLAGAISGCIPLGFGVLKIRLGIGLRSGEWPAMVGLILIAAAEVFVVSVLRDHGDFGRPLLCVVLTLYVPLLIATSAWLAGRAWALTRRCVAK